MYQLMFNVMFSNEMKLWRIWKISANSSKSLNEFVVLIILLSENRILSAVCFNRSTVHSLNEIRLHFLKVMDDEVSDLASKLIGSLYVDQALCAANSFENDVKELLRHVRLLYTFYIGFSTILLFVAKTSEGRMEWICNRTISFPTFTYG